MLQRRQVLQKITYLVRSCSLAATGIQLCDQCPQQFYIMRQLGRLEAQTISPGKRRLAATS